MSQDTQPLPPVSVIVAMRNSATTIIPCLKGLINQEYPVAEIIVVDNVSTDNSAALTEQIAATSTIPLRLIKQTVNGGLATSFNTGASEARSSLLVFVHSDSMLPTPHELGKLVSPLLQDPGVVASYPFLLMPYDIWVRFPYWQKLLFTGVAMREASSMCGKFDCVRKESFLKVGGQNTRRFTATCGYGGEDSDLIARLIKAGQIVPAEARVIHLHDLSCDYGLLSLFRTRKMLARTYGKILVFQGLRPIMGKLPFFAKPVLACLPFVPHCFWISMALFLVFSLVYSRKMYLSRCTLFDRRIVLVPFVDMALIYHETFWFLEGLITPPADAKPMGEHARGGNL
jgi:glycosyltransferase involved in cell wall biosynthesis